MAFELKIQEQFISGDGLSLGIIDISDWTQETRANYALLLLANKIEADLTEVKLGVTSVDPMTDDDWAVVLQGDGRVNATAYAHLLGVSTDVPVEGTVNYLTDTEVLSTFDTGVWREATDEEAIASAVYTSNLLNLSVLVSAYNYKNKLNLQYITQVKNDLASGVKQNELYYKRTSLDYVSSLIAGAELNFGLELYTIYYNIVDNLNLIVSTGKLS